jgi:hypothetical protein
LSEIDRNKAVCDTDQLLSQIQISNLNDACVADRHWCDCCGQMLSFARPCTYQRSFEGWKASITLVSFFFLACDGVFPSEDTHQRFVTQCRIMRGAVSKDIPVTECQALLPVFLSLFRLFFQLSLPRLFY